jgi:hypothetical protein
VAGQDLFSFTRAVAVCTQTFVLPGAALQREHHPNCLGMVWCNLLSSSPFGAIGSQPCAGMLPLYCHSIQTARPRATAQHELQPCIYMRPHALSHGHACHRTDVPHACPCSGALCTYAHMHTSTQQPESSSSVRAHRLHRFRPQHPQIHSRPHAQLASLAASPNQ